VQNRDSTCARRREAGSARNPRPNLASIILGKMKRLATLRLERGIPVDAYRWAQVIAAELDEPTLSNLSHWCRRCGLDSLPLDLERAIIDQERERRTRRRRLSKTAIGRLLDLVTVERDELQFTFPVAIDETPAEGRRRRARERATKEAGAAKIKKRKDRRKAQDRKRKADQRRAEGRPTREDRARAGAARRAAIEASGMSPATYYRRLKKARSENVASAENVASWGDLKRGANRSDPKAVTDGSALTVLEGTLPDQATGSRDVRSPEAAPVPSACRPAVEPVAEEPQLSLFGDLPLADLTPPDAVRQLRETHRLSQRRLGALMGLSSSGSIGNVERLHDRMSLTRQRIVRHMAETGWAVMATPAPQAEGAPARPAENSRMTWRPAPRLPLRFGRSPASVLRLRAREACPAGRPA
jgi:hypothetical protein